MPLGFNQGRDRVQLGRPVGMRGLWERAADDHPVVAFVLGVRSAWPPVNPSSHLLIELPQAFVHVEPVLAFLPLMGVLGSEVDRPRAHTLGLVLPFFVEI